VISGFRLSPGGAQQLLGIVPDMTTLGKIIGGGLPLAAYGGRADIMDMVAPVGPVYQAGTLSGNPLAVAAGLAVLDEIEKQPHLYADLNAKRERLQASVSDSANRRGIPHRINGIGSLMTVFFTADPVTDYASAKRSDTERYARVFRAALDRGVCLAPSQFEAAFVSAAHAEDDLDEAVRGLDEALSA
jgi:glutamate-1-semialdehyde 2,1-aminomutase